MWVTGKIQPPLQHAMDEIENFLLAGQVEDGKEEFREYQFDPRWDV